MSGRLDLDAIRALHLTPPLRRPSPSLMFDMRAAIRDLCREVDGLRSEVAQLDAVCRWNREHVATVVDEEFGMRLGGMACEHPSLTGDRCDVCGWTEAWDADA